MWLYPFILVGLGAIALRGRSLWARHRDLAIMLTMGILFGLSTVTATSVTFNSSTMRYVVDFVPAFALVAAIGWAWSYATFTRASVVRVAMAATWTLALGVSTLVGFALVLTPCPGTGSC